MDGKTGRIVPEKKKVTGAARRCHVAQQRACHIAHLWHGPQLVADVLVNGAHGQIKDIRLAEHKIGLAAAGHCLVAGRQTVPHRPHHHHRRHANGNADQGQQAARTGEWRIIW